MLHKMGVGRGFLWFEAIRGSEFFVTRRGAPTVPKNYCPGYVVSTINKIHAKPHYIDWVDTAALSLLEKMRRAMNSGKFIFSACKITIILEKNKIFVLTITKFDVWKRRNRLTAKSVPKCRGFFFKLKNDENFWHGKIVQIESEQPLKLQRYVNFQTIANC